MIVVMRIEIISPHKNFGRHSLNNKIICFITCTISKIYAVNNREAFPEQNKFIGGGDIF